MWGKGTVGQELLQVYNEGTFLQVTEMDTGGGSALSGTGCRCNRKKIYPGNRSLRREEESGGQKYFDTA